VTASAKSGFIAPEPGGTFAEALARLPLGRLLEVSRNATAAGVERALATPPLDRTLSDFATLLSRAASERLENLAQASRRLTLAQFGRTMHMYAPLYPSNECLTTCVYCGFARRAPYRAQDPDAG